MVTAAVLAATPLGLAACHDIIVGCPGPTPGPIPLGMMGSANGVAVVADVSVHEAVMQENGSLEASVGAQGYVQVAFLVVDANATPNGTVGVTVDMPETQQGVEWVNGPDHAFELNTAGDDPVSVYSAFDVTDTPDGTVSIPITVDIGGETVTGNVWFAEVGPPSPPPSPEDPMGTPLPATPWALVALAVVAVLYAARRPRR